MHRGEAERRDGEMERESEIGEVFGRSRFGQVTKCCFGFSESTLASSCA